MRKVNLVPEELKETRLVSWGKVNLSKLFKLGKGSRAGVVLDKNGSPQLFLFDTFALLDVLSQIDEALVDRLSTEEYHSKSVNPAGWLIDEIESKLPLNPTFVSSLKSAIEEANKKGWVPLSKIQADLGIA
jgi:hypothetical protein